VTWLVLCPAIPGSLPGCVLGTVPGILDCGPFAHGIPRAAPFNRGSSGLYDLFGTKLESEEACCRIQVAVKANAYSGGYKA
jgi:hypothetical protein